MSLEFAQERDMQRLHLLHTTEILLHSLGNVFFFDSTTLSFTGQKVLPFASKLEDLMQLLMEGRKEGGKVGGRGWGRKEGG